MSDKPEYYLDLPEIGPRRVAGLSLWSIRHYASLLKAMHIKESGGHVNMWHLLHTVRDMPKDKFDKLVGQYREHHEKFIERGLERIVDRLKNIENE